MDFSIAANIVSFDIAARCMKRGAWNSSWRLIRRTHAKVCKLRRMPDDDAEFKAAMSHFASGVTIVTTEHDGKPFGMTVASFASLSLHPPLILICIEKAV